MNAKTVAFVSRHRDRSEPSCRMMRGLNFRIRQEVELVDRPLDKRPRAQRFRFRKNRLRIGRYARQDRPKVHALGPLLDHDHGFRRVRHRQKDEDGRGQAEQDDA